MKNFKDSFKKKISDAKNGDLSAAFAAVAGAGVAGVGAYVAFHVAAAVAAPVAIVGGAYVGGKAVYKKMKNKPKGPGGQ